MIDTSKIFKTCKEDSVAGYFCYSFEIDGCTHYVFGETKEEAFNFMADFIKEYTKNQ